ncbi:PREDICTED: interferon regulatory factor 7 [Chaetura pelagica]|uniref:interferon regulatory factor 7 n=1 Tax=Chaetura pelagica TaxID=8897 RepID=UPI0005231DA7|nr:PREDICTED: interferon regulatory factor 7 [Chaetura pelagica]
MAALQSEGEAQKLRFGPWLVNAVNSGKYPGLCWTDPAQGIFRVPWKHNARKDVTSSDLEIFKAWAKASGRYEGCPEDPAKWKTNFRCALRSTRMFELLDDHSKSGDDPHKVFAITPVALSHSEEGDFSSCDPVVEQQPLHQQLQLKLVSQDIPLGSTDPTQPPVLKDMEELQQVLKQCGISPRDAGPHNPSWEPAGEMMLLAPAASPAPVPPLPERNTDGIIPLLDISIYYRGRLFHQEEVEDSRCLLAYQTSDPALALRPGHLVRFPSPAELADGKQRQYTEKLLGIAGLQLEQRSHKLFATRLKKCKIFWVLSQQLEGVGDPPSNELRRDKETPIFDFNEFCSELRDFRNRQRRQSPDFTIYLCFGQSFSKAKPKESKLILVKLVPKFCEYWYEQVLREGASSLDSGTVSLQLSDSFSLFELIEQCDMQVD